MTAQQVKALAIFQRTTVIAPRGLHDVDGKKRYLPITFKDQAMELRIFDEVRDDGCYAYGFFWAWRRYGRMTLLVYHDGRVKRDDHSVTPDFDKDPRDAVIADNVVEELLTVISQALDDAA